MGFQLVPKVVTLNELERRDGHYIAIFHQILDLGANYIKVIEVRSVMSATKM